MKKIADVTASLADLGPLAFLSLQHTPRGIEPDAFTNEERARAFRDALPVVTANTYRWAFREETAHAVGG